MSEDSPPLMSADADDPADRPLSDDLRLLIDDGRTLLEAELAYQKSRAIATGSGIATVVGWAVAGFVILLLAVIAALFGVVLELSVLFGAAGATLIVVFSMLVLATLCALIVQNKWRKVRRMIGDDQP
jgi:hypothetical protein